MGERSCYETDQPYTHVLNIFSEEGSPLLDVAPSGDVARCAESFSSLDPIIVDGVEVPLISGSFGEVEGLPDPQPGVVYVVSGLVSGFSWVPSRISVWKSPSLTVMKRSAPES